MSEEIPEKWDEEVDVIVIGAGTAGLPASASAANAGATTLVLEQMLCVAGSAVRSGGWINIPGTEVQRKLNINDSPDLYFKDAMKVTHGDPALWRKFVKNAPKTYEILKLYGAEPSIVERVPGCSVARSHLYNTHELYDALEKESKEAGAEILFKHKVVGIYRDPETKRVVGVKVRRSRGEYVNFKAKKAVILASGGWHCNPMMVWQYGSYRHAKTCAPAGRGHTGEVIEMAIRLGAYIKWVGTSTCASTPIVPFVWRGAIAVNKEGRRFVNESSLLFPTLGEAHFRQPESIVCVIYDQSLRDRIAKYVEKALLLNERKADALEDLAKQLNINPENLVKEIQEYNDDISAYGYDRKFGRNDIPCLESKPVKIETPPFYGIKFVPVLTSVKSGLVMNPEAQILNYEGKPIAGLYGAGEVSCGGISRDGYYICGTMINWSQTYGRIAGTNAATKE